MLLELTVLPGLLALKALPELPDFKVSLGLLGLMVLPELLDFKVSLESKG